MAIIKDMLNSIDTSGMLVPLDKLLISNGQEQLLLDGAGELITFNTKTYVTSPSRSGDGSIPNINDYDTFHIPRCKVNIKYMNVSTYQAFCRMMSSANEFICTYFDTEKGMDVSNKMYMTPQDSFTLYNVQLKAVGVRNVTIDLVGTLNPLSNLTLTYNANGGSGTFGGSNIYYATSYFSGQTITLRPLTYLSRSGYTVGSWNTASNGSGTTYSANQVITPVANLILYAQWTFTHTYKLTFEPVGGTLGETVVNPIDVTLGSAIGTLPLPTFDGYTFANWFTAINGGGTQWTSSTTYPYDYNAKIYAHWTLNSYNIAYSLDGGTNGANPATYDVEDGTITLLNATKTNYTFKGWWTTATFDSGTQVSLINSTLISGKANGTTITLYAKWLVV